MVAMITGAALVVSVTPVSHQRYVTAGQIFGYVLHKTFLLTALVVTVGLTMLGIVASVVAPVLKPFFLGLTCAACGSYGMTLFKVGAEVVGKTEHWWLNVELYVLAIFALAVCVIQVHTLNLGLRHGEVVTIIPTFFALGVLFSLFQAEMAFGELNDLGGATHIVMFVAGVVLVIGSTLALLLLQRDEEEEIVKIADAQDEERIELTVPATFDIHFTDIAEAPGSAEGPTTATAEQVSDVRLEFGENGEDSMPANSALLRMASPVFNRMFTSGMREAQQGVIKVEVASKEEFKVFYDFLLPMAWGAPVTVDSVDSLLAISDYYQVEIIKQRCENYLLRCAPTGSRLLQAHKHGLTSQYERCIGALAKKSTKADLAVLRSQPDILLDLTLRKQAILDRLRAMKGVPLLHDRRTNSEPTLRRNSWSISHLSMVPNKSFDSVQEFTLLSVTGPMGLFLKQLGHTVEFLRSRKEDIAHGVVKNASTGCINCCSSIKPDFRCGKYDDPKAHGGLRLVGLKDQFVTFFWAQASFSEEIWGKAGADLLKQANDLVSDAMGKGAAGLGELKSKAGRSSGVTQDAAATFVALARTELKATQEFAFCLSYGGELVGHDAPSAATTLDVEGSRHCRSLTITERSIVILLLLLLIIIILIVLLLIIITIILIILIVLLIAITIILIILMVLIILIVLIITIVITITIIIIIFFFFIITTTHLHAVNIRLRLILMRHLRLNAQARKAQEAHPPKLELQRRNAPQKGVGALAQPGDFKGTAAKPKILSAEEARERERTLRPVREKMLLAGISGCWVRLLFREIGVPDEEVQPMLKALQADSVESDGDAVKTAEVHCKNGNYSKALEVANKALESFKSANDKAGQAAALVVVASAHRGLGDKPAGLQAARAALPLAYDAQAKVTEAAARRLCADLRASKAPPKVTPPAFGMTKALDHCVPGVSGPAHCPTEPFVGLQRLVGTQESKKLSGQVAVVTGASRGIAQSLAEETDIILMGTVDETASTFGKLGGTGVAVHVDHAQAFYIPKPDMIFFSTPIWNQPMRFLRLVYFPGL
ncbi:unnamed protein product [Symbiodinium microadriaticum]|nr:unnamed protein product [Symbiodinium microadriaticum]